ncbi:MAG: hypothetical protein PF447_14670 [Spirochaetaceae bacterium]|nr:hypothetical protein [Spirochaetaceae bacterium]
MKYIAALLLSLMVFFSCQVNNKLYLEQNGSGTMDTEIVLVNFFQEFFFDIFDQEMFLQEIKDDLVLNPTLQSSQIESMDNGFSSHVQFTRIDLLTGTTGGLINWSIQNGIKHLTITINRENWSQLEEMIPMLLDPSISYMGPQGSAGLTRDEFKEMLLYPFAGYAESQDSALESLDLSNIQFSVQVDGEIIDVDNGEKLDGQNVVFTINLFDMLMLDTPLVYGLSYR